MYRLAVVEDNPDNRLLVHAMLDDAYDIVEFGDGHSALEGLKAARPDLVLLDISLPGMDGVEVLARLRRDPDTATLPVIALTAHAMAGDRVRFMNAGFDDYVTKPIADEGLLFAAIERWLAPDAVGGARRGS
ncbi:MAG TPA: response regulator [Gemmatimonadales bacterium]|jgi:CheY-like chemotaxis protein